MQTLHAMVEGQDHKQLIVEIVFNGILDGYLSEKWQGWIGIDIFLVIIITHFYGNKYDNMDDHDLMYNTIIKRAKSLNDQTKKRKKAF